MSKNKKIVKELKKIRKLLVAIHEEFEYAHEEELPIPDQTYTKSKRKGDQIPQGDFPNFKNPFEGDLD